MPKITELMDRVLELVAEEMEVPREQILSKSRRAETVDARHVVVKLLHAHNVYAGRIGRMLGLSARSVNYVVTTFDARIQMNRSLRRSYAILAKRLGENCEITAK